MTPDAARAAAVPAWCREIAGTIMGSLCEPCAPFILPTREAVADNIARIIAQDVPDVVARHALETARRMEVARGALEAAKKHIVAECDPFAGGNHDLMEQVRSALALLDAPMEVPHAD